MRPVENDFEKVISINRTTKVTKGGKKLSFSALVVAGNRNGRVGCGFGKANEVPNAIKKGISDAKKNMINVPMRGTTIPHEIIGKYGAAVVFLRPAGEGTGVIAGNIIRAACEGAGIKDILTKCMRSQTPSNILKATFDGFKKLRFKNELLEHEPQETEVKEIKNENQ
ncbi:MAG: 30S ribosomal protein S5 [Candidatus Omnitrophica bacterium]|nr:30S ribosomal protein S5 [Candidatus Omnitrophota bacterium]